MKSRSPELRKASILIAAFLLSSFLHAVDPPGGERVSLDSSGNQANGSSYNPTSDASGRYVAFDSNASNLFQGDINGFADVFIKDRLTGSIERVSVNASGAEANGASRQPSLSSDGRYVVFSSGATNLVAGDANGEDDIFLKDRMTGALELISVTPSGEQAAEGCRYPYLSPDARFVVFESQSINLVTGSTTKHNVFIKNRMTGAIELISVDSDENNFTGSSYPDSISSDGNLVGFTLENFSPFRFECYVRDRTAGTTTLVSVNRAAARRRPDFGRCESEVTCAHFVRL